MKYKEYWARYSILKLYLLGYLSDIKQFSNIEFKNKEWFDYIYKESSVANGANSDVNCQISCTNDEFCELFATINNKCFLGNSSLTENGEYFSDFEMTKLFFRPGKTKFA